MKSSIPARGGGFQMARLADPGHPCKAGRRTRLTLEFVRIAASPAMQRDEGAVEAHRNRVRCLSRLQSLRRGHSVQARLSVTAPAARESSGSRAFRRGSGSGSHRHRERRGRETRPTWVRKSNPHRLAVHPRAWPASAGAAGSREVAHLMVYRALSISRGRSLLLGAKSTNVSSTWVPHPRLSVFWRDRVG